ncbi:MAG: protein-L-isoaspartate(D-aspartate) O-methyltransferase [Anaerolineae bacterium]|nr:protein-L-isoaspartate(D-aspartate) O-methyltransferase [Anaerolineae bacterium]
MVREQIEGRGVTEPRILQAMTRVPRHLFVPEDLHQQAYSDGPLPIGSGQTISQPYIVALMTELLNVQPGDRVLEIGVGSGYQTAILAELAAVVIGVERLPDLAQMAESRLRSMGYQNVSVHVTDGSEGLPEAAPYDAILVAAAAPNVPKPLIEQLAEGGRLVIPVGGTYDQVIERLTREGKAIHRERLTPVRFVPLIGKHGFKGW